MSIRAMNWAMGARTDGVSAQCVLFVVADTANEHGVSIHADPDYIAARTRQSRATVFRRLKELEQAGALTRLKRFRDDGAPIYEIRLKLDVEIDYDTPPDDGGATQDIEGESQIETPPQSQIETGKVSPVRQAESQSCDSKSPSKNPEDSPPTPQEGGNGPAIEPARQASEAGQAIEIEGWSEFKSAFEADQVPILRISIAKDIFAALKPPERTLVVSAARGLIAQRAREKKPGMKPSAQTFLREIESWSGFAKLAPPLPPLPKPKITLLPGSDEFKAIVLCRAVAWMPPMDDGQSVEFIGQPPAGAHNLAALANIPQSQWILIGKRDPRYVAWCERLKEWLGFWPEDRRYWLNAAGEIVPSVQEAEGYGDRSRLPKSIDGLRFPPTPDGWPPRKDIAKSSTDPPKESSAA